MANLISFSRIILSIVLIASFKNLSDYSLVALILLAAVTDYFDGYVARKNNEVSTFGAVLDPVADRILVLCICIILLIKFSQPLLNLAALLLIVREVLITIGFMVLRNKGIRLEVSYFGKVGTAFVFTSFVITFLMPKLGIYLLLMAIIVYILSALDYGQKAWRQIVKEN